MKILIVNTFMPEPIDQGDPVRVRMLIASLESLGQVTLLATRRVTTRSIDEVALRKAVPDTHVMYFDARSSKPMTLWDKISNFVESLLRLRPLWVNERVSSKLQDWVDQKSQNFDVTVLIGEAAGAVAASVRSRATIWDKANVLGPSTSASIFTSSTLKARLRAIINAPLALFFERRTLKRVTSVWVTSQAEANALAQAYTYEADAIIRSAVEHSSSTPNRIDADAKNILWMSSFAYSANWDGLIRFLGAADDYLYAAGYTLLVAGSAAKPSQIDRLKRYRSVHYMGYVEDLSSVVEQSRAGVIPIWSGAGVKLKTLTLAGLGLPLVGTPQAFEGIDARAALKISDDPLAMAKSITCATEEDLASASLLAKHVVLEDFGPERFQQQVKSAFMEAIS